jgi:hypothetical protein
MAMRRAPDFAIPRLCMLLAAAGVLLAAPRTRAQSDSLASSITSGILDPSFTAFAADPNGFTSSYSFTPGVDMTLNNREWLYLSSALSPSNPDLTVAGTFDITNSGDFLTVALHTDADTTVGVGRGTQYGVDLNSLQVTFSTFGGNLGISITAVQNPESVQYVLTNVPFTFNTGQNYNFSITDNGSLISVYVGGVLQTSFNYFSSPYYVPSGTNVLVYSRESISGLELSALTIDAVPEPATYLQLGLGIAAVAGLLGYRRVSRARAA